MRINEILNKKKTLSFEVFPPKKDGEDLKNLYKTIDDLKQLNPDFISVTYGAGGTNRNSNVEIASYIKKTGVEALAHFTGGPTSKEEARKTIKSFQEHQIDNILVLRGDKPIDFNGDFCHDFAHASDLASFVGNKEFSLGGACYPEGHSECTSLYEDLLNMKAKEEAGVSFFITQIFYDNSYYYRLVNEARKIGIKSPIIPGIMPLISANSIKRIKNMCGSTIPLDFRNMIEVYQNNKVLMKEIGYNYAVYQIMDLLAKGAPGVHLYIMNNAETAKEIYSRLENVFHEMF